MKVIDLLNKIANGEEVPSIIQLYGVTFYFIKEKECYFSKYDEVNILDMYSHCLRNKGKLLLNDEVEIIEEDKKIEKITLLGEEIKSGSLSNWLSGTTINEEKIASCIECNAMKINEIIEKINGVDKE